LLNEVLTDDNENTTLMEEMSVIERSVSLFCSLFILIFMCRSRIFSGGSDSEMIDSCLLDGSTSPSSFFSDDCSLSALSGSDKLVKKHRKSTRKPSFRPAFIPSLRIVKRDIRRKYGEMMMNVMNSHDISFLSSFVCDFCNPSMEMLDSGAPDAIYEEYHWPRQAQGFITLLSAMKMSFEVFPDSIFRMKDYMISVRLGEKGSRLTGTLVCKRSQLYDIEFQSDKNDHGNEKAQEKSGSSSFPSYKLIPIKTIKEYHMECKFTILLDELHRLESIQIMFSQFQQVNLN
jgi:hypothetical protein